jgi:uncharacterized protein YggE
VVNVGVQSLGPTASAALADNSTKMERLLKAIGASGIPPAKVQTTGIRLNSRYEYDRVDGRQQRRFVGYEASNGVRIVIDDVSRAGELLDKFVAAGGENLSGPYFSISNPEPLRARARREALAKADLQAAAYAAARGYTRARMISINDGGSSFDGPIILASRGLESAAAPAPPPPPPPPPIAPGEVSTSVSLTVQYILEK